MGVDFGASGAVGIIGSFGTGIGSYYGAQAQGVQLAGQYNALATSALIDSEALSSKYKINAINMEINALAEQTQYEAASAEYQLEALRKKGQASLYDQQSAIELLAKSNSLRTAGALGVSALEEIRQGAEEEAKLREQGLLFQAEQKTAMAAGGTDSSSGNALDILRQTDEGIEADSASIRYRAQKNRYNLLVQQKNMWMQAEVQQLNSENYNVTSQNMLNSAEISVFGADIMKKMGDVAYKSGMEGKDLYNQLSGLALQSGRATADSYRKISDIYSSAAKSVGVANLIGAVAGGVANSGLLSSGADKKNSGSKFEYNSMGNVRAADEWGTINNSMAHWDDYSDLGTNSEWWKKNEYKFGKFMPLVKSYKGLGGS